MKACGLFAGGFLPGRVGLSLGRAPGTDQPIDHIETYWSPIEKAQATRMLVTSIVGSPDTVCAGIEALVKETQADESIVVSDICDDPRCCARSN